MIKEQKQIFDRNPVLRDHYYQECIKDWKRADQFFHFVREAWSRGYLSTFEINVDNQTVRLTLSGASPYRNNLFEYLANFAAGVAYREAATIEEMRQIWPELPDPGLVSVGKRPAKIVLKRP